CWSAAWAPLRSRRCAITGRGGREPSRAEIQRLILLVRFSSRPALYWGLPSCFPPFQVRLKIWLVGNFLARTHLRRQREFAVQLDIAYPCSAIVLLKKWKPFRLEEEQLSNSALRRLLGTTAYGNNLATVLLYFSSYLESNISSQLVECDEYTPDGMSKGDQP